MRIQLQPFRYLIVLTILLLSHNVLLSGNAFGGQPNILLILADDMGYGDLGYTGSQTLETPHLDSLARNGRFCKQAYVASPVCSPSRAGLLTGRDPRRFGYEGNLNQSAANYATRPELLGLPPGEHTLADHLGAAGYETALIGKWHQGMGPGFHPNERGFDFFCGMLGGSHSYFLESGKGSLERNGKSLDEFSSSYVTDFFTDEAVKWIEQQSAPESPKPWFMFLSYNAPHAPMQATEEDLQRFEHITNGKRRTYAAMMYALDRGIGRVIEQLESSGVSEETLIVFFSDNGGATSNGSWNGPLSGAKGCLKEGGVRVPMIWSWPGKIGTKTQLETSQTTEPVEFEGIASSLDLLPTFLAAADAKPLPLSPPASHIDKRNQRRMIAAYGEYDGINLLPYLRNDSDVSELPDRMLFWRLQGQAAVLSDKDKLIRLNHRPAQLFRPASDAAELNDVASGQPARFRELYQTLGAWEAMLPTVPLWGSSPFWDSESAEHYDNWSVRPEPEAK